MGLAEVQVRLRGLGFDPGPIDGVWGPGTEQAVNAALAMLRAAPVALRFDRARFFDAIRPLFGSSLTVGQVEGMENLLDVWEAHYAFDPIEHLAYDLGTAFHETARTMQPIQERGERAYFAKYESGTAIGRRLGNTEPGDGYRFRGEGHVQNTGRANARKASERLNAAFGYGVDLEAQPELRGDPVISAHSLILGNREGWWTGKKLADYLPGDWAGARRVVNGTDRAALIAGYGKRFLSALTSASTKGASA